MGGVVAADAVDAAYRKLRFGADDRQTDDGGRSYDERSGHGGRIVAETTFIATVPDKYASTMQASEALQLLPCPFDMPSFAVQQHWHERFHAEPAIRWLRTTFSMLFTE
jgi:DNA-binding transcriptional LysR family regulator